MTPHDAQVLDIAGRFYRRPGSRDAAAAELGLTPTRYAQRLNALCDDPEAWRARPVLIGRLRRIRDTKTARLGRLGVPIGNTSRHTTGSVG